MSTSLQKTILFVFNPIWLDLYTGFLLLFFCIYGTNLLLYSSSLSYKGRDRLSVFFHTFLSVFESTPHPPHIFTNRTFIHFFSSRFSITQFNYSFRLSRHRYFCFRHVQAFLSIPVATHIQWRIGPPWYRDNPGRPSSLWAFLKWFIYYNSVHCSTDM